MVLCSSSSIGSRSLAAAWRPSNGPKRNGLVHPDSMGEELADLMGLRDIANGFAVSLFRPSRPRVVATVAWKSAM